MKGILIILAGGRSQRMGQPKGLLKYHDFYWLEEQLLRAEQAKFEKIIIVLGDDHALYFERMPVLESALQKFINYKSLKISVVVNKNPQFGPFSSIVAALNSLKTKNDVFVLPVDVPLMAGNEIDKLRNSKYQISIPAYKNKKGHPVKLGYDFWKDLKLIDLDAIDARLDHQIKHKDKKLIDIVDVVDAQAILNLNTTEVWADFLKLNK